MAFCLLSHTHAYTVSLCAAGRVPCGDCENIFFSWEHSEVDVCQVTSQLYIFINRESFRFTAALELIHFCDVCLIFTRFWFVFHCEAIMSSTAATNKWPLRHPPPLKHFPPSGMMGHVSVQRLQRSHWCGHTKPVWWQQHLNVTPLWFAWKLFQMTNVRESFYTLKPDGKSSCQVCGCCCARVCTVSVYACAGAFYSWVYDANYFLWQCHHKLFIWLFCITLLQEENETPSRVVLNMNSDCCVFLFSICVWGHNR